MITKVGQIMVYVNDQDQAVKFWTEKMGFHVMSEQNNEQGMRWIELAPAANAETTIILHNKQLIAKMQPELNVGTPSLMFFTENVDELYRDLTAKGVTVGEIVSMPSGKVFNFSDSEDNYFAVMENANNE
ncbi:MULTISPECIES: VOC family protein [Priestia]|uniref:VOC family protein n=1 Tax=Priestia TaxID=2800373 RepID=UPI000402C8DA|nr:MULTISPECIES: VOC family protein [Priestia]ANF47053.1 glyoxalase [Priestia megaterium]AQU74742.1 glyoxalase/bleomycin resistance/extradiol dioxygenase family protein [Priestia megaterium]